MGYKEWERNNESGDSWKQDLSLAFSPSGELTVEREDTFSFLFNIEIMDNRTDFLLLNLLGLGK